MASLSKQLKRSRIGRLLRIRAKKHSDEKAAKRHSEDEKADLSPFYGDRKRDRLDIEAMSYLLPTKSLFQLADFIRSPKKELRENANRKQQLHKAMQEINRLVAQN